MKTVLSTVPVLAILALLATGCGSAEPTAAGSTGSGESSGTPSRTPSPSAPASGAASSSPGGGCTSAGAMAPGAIRFLGEVDLEGNAHPDEVGVSAASGDCQTLHLVVAGRAVSVPITSGPPLTSAYAVRLAGHAGDLLVTRQVSPRGGFQTRIFAYAGGTVTEITTDGHPLVPFVATDVSGQHVSVDCQGDQVVLTQALAHRPGMAWKIQRTSYRLDGASAVRAASEESLDDVLAKPLLANAVFPSCRAG